MERKKNTKMRRNVRTHGSGRGQELRGQGLVPVVPEHQVRGGERCRRLAGGLGPGRALGDLVQRPRRVHVLWALPALVVGVAVANLVEKKERKKFIPPKRKHLTSSAADAWLMIDSLYEINTDTV
jgi:hypothetical protein